VVEKEVAMSSTGELKFKVPQQEWTGDDAIQSSYFAGQEMFIRHSNEQPDNFELHYLGLKVSGFEVIDDAKFNAPEFARSVFQILGDFIKDN
jgi:hypothetical protein